MAVYTNNLKLKEIADGAESGSRGDRDWETYC